jgi:hypothetical protein
MPQKDPCELCIIKVICTVLCKEKIDQVANKIVKRKKLKNPNYSKIGGVLVSDFVAELAKDGKLVWKYDDERIEVKNGVIKRTTGGA